MDLKIFLIQIISFMFINKISYSETKFIENIFICPICKIASNLWLLIDRKENDDINNIRVLRQDILNSNYFIEFELKKANENELTIDKGYCFSCLINGCCA